MTENIGIMDIFKKVSDPAQKLLISMTHFSEVGGKKDSVLATSGLESEQLDKALEELRQFNLVQTGKVLTEGRKQTFVVGEGERFRLAPQVQEAIFKDILKMKP